MPLMIIDASYRIEVANDPAKELLGANIEGQNAVTILRQAATLAAIDAAIRDGQEGQARFMLAGVAGEVIYMFHARPLPNGAGAVLSFEDRSQAEESEMIRRNFVANISHELRTPLTSLMGFIETLRGPARKDEAARERFLQIMEQEANRMSRMVSDLLSLSRVEADERIRPRQSVNLCAVLRSVVATLEGKLKDANVAVQTSGLEQRAKIAGDRDQLIQLFLNLIENAIKYGGQDCTVHIAVCEIKRDPTLRMSAWRVDIQDEGEGIDQIHLPRLTERFYRVDDDRSRQKGGTGLGLAIVKHIVNRHRGRLKIQSEQGVGSTFSTIFPKEDF